jgi:hypothetical protein
MPARAGGARRRLTHPPAAARAIGLAPQRTSSPRPHRRRHTISVRAEPRADNGGVRDPRGADQLSPVSPCPDSRARSTASPFAWDGYRRSGAAPVQPTSEDGIERSAKAMRVAAAPATRTISRIGPSAQPLSSSAHPWSIPRSASALARNCNARLPRGNARPGDRFRVVVFDLYWQTWKYALRLRSKPSLTNSAHALERTPNTLCRILSVA